MGNMKIFIPFFIFVFLLSASSCENHRIKKEISTVNEELPIKIEDGFTLSNIVYGSDENKTVFFNFNVEQFYYSLIYEIKENGTNEDISNFRNEVFAELRKHQTIKDLISLIVERKHSIVLKFTSPSGGTVTINPVLNLAGSPVVVN